MNWKLLRFIDRYAGILLLHALSWTRFSRTKNMARRDVKTILLVKFCGIGNLLMMLPSLQALRATYPEARFHLLTLESNRNVLEAIREVDEVYTVKIGSFTGFIASTCNTLLKLRRNRYDIAVDFEQFARFSVLLSCLVGAKELIGFRTADQHRHHLLTNPVSYDNTLHTTRSFYSLAEEAGANAPLPLEINLSAMPEIVRAGETILLRFGIKRDEVVILMHVGTSGNFSERRWPPRRYAELANLLTKEGGRVIFTGLKEESSLVRGIFRDLDKPSAALDLSGLLSFTEYFGLIAVSRLVISADTSAVHLASSVGVPVVGLYGPNTPLLYGPWGTKGYAIYEPPECSPCITNFNAKIHTCRHPAGRGACMSRIRVDQVFALIKKEHLCEQAPCPKISREASG